MTKEALNIISKSMKSIGVPYKFMRFNGKVEYPYFVGEYADTEPVNEDGLEESTFLLTGFHRGTWLELENTKDKIKKKLDEYKAITDTGSAVAIFYAGAQPIDTGDAELKRIQINLKVKEWKVK